MIRCALCQDRVTSRFGVLNVLLHESDAENLATFVGAFADHCRDTTMKEGIEFLKDRCFSDSRFGLVTTNIQVLLEILDCWSTYISALAHLSEGKTDLLQHRVVGIGASSRHVPRFVGLAAHPYRQ
jgi:hypothetical protein